jgi:hypothetical protein
VLTRREPAVLVEHVVGGQQALVVIALEMAAPADGDRVGEPPPATLHATRQTKQQQQVGMATGQFRGRALARLGHPLPQHQIARRIAEQRHLRRQQHGGARGPRVVRRRVDACEVALHISNGQVKLGRRDAHGTDATAAASRTP